MSNHSPFPSPPTELVREWLCSDDYPWGPLEQSSITITTNRLQNVATQAARWGADQELEACVEWLDRNSPVIGGFHLRIDRRPKPPSLAKRALHILGTHGDLSCAEHDTIRRALEALDD